MKKVTFETVDKLPVWTWQVVPNPFALKHPGIMIAWRTTASSYGTATLDILHSYLGNLAAHDIKQAVYAAKQSGKLNEDVVNDQFF